MKRYIATLILATISIQLLNGAVLNSIKFQGDIDLITGEFNRERLLKVCHIEPPQFYEFWKKEAGVLVIEILVQFGREIGEIWPRGLG